MEKRLIRNMPGKMIGGVAAGLADYLAIDTTIMRLLFVVATFFGGSGLLIYIVLWIAMPAGSVSGGYPRQAEGTNTGVPGSPEPPLQNPVQQPLENESSGKGSAAVIGWILVGLGIFFLMDEFLEPWFREFFYWFNFTRIWPVIFIIVGVLIISSANKKAATQEPEAGPADKPGPPDTPGSPGTTRSSDAPRSSNTPSSPDTTGSPGTVGSPVPPASPGSAGPLAPGESSGEGPLAPGSKPSDPANKDKR